MDAGSGSEHFLEPPTKRPTASPEHPDISIIPQKKPPLVWICPETRVVSSVGISPAAFGGRIPLVKHCWAPSAPTEETPLVSSCPETRGVSSEGGGFFCGIVLIE